MWALAWRLAQAVFGIALIWLLLGLYLLNQGQRPVFRELVAAVDRVAAAEELRGQILVNQHVQLNLLLRICHNTARSAEDAEQCRRLIAND